MNTVRIVNPGGPSPEDDLLAGGPADVDNIQTVPEHRPVSMIPFLFLDWLEEVNQAIVFALRVDAFAIRSWTFEAGSFLRPSQSLTGIRVCRLPMT